MHSPEKYDRDYFERGPETGKSLYRNYRWLPWQTAVMAHSIVEAFELQRGARVLDVGCAKGFLVRALRFFDIDATGCDVSEYAIEHCDPSVRFHVHRMVPELLLTWGVFDLVVCKDVLEHVPDPVRLLDTLAQCGERILVVVPLGDGERFTIPEYSCDATHLHAHPMAWWEDVLDRAHWRVERTAYRWPGIKDHWYDVNDLGNGFLVGSSTL